MKRYGPGWGGIEPEDDGDYVEYDEAAARIARLEAALREIKARADAAFNEGVESAAKYLDRVDEEVLADLVRALKRPAGAPSLGEGAAHVGLEVGRGDVGD